MPPGTATQHAESLRPEAAATTVSTGGGQGAGRTPPFRETDGSGLSAAAATPAVAVADENRPDAEAESAVGVVIIAEAEVIRVAPVGV